MLFVCWRGSGEVTPVPQAAVGRPLGEPTLFFRHQTGSVARVWQKKKHSGLYFSKAHPAHANLTANLREKNDYCNSGQKKKLLQKTTPPRRPGITSAAFYQCYKNVKTPPPSLKDLKLCFFVFHFLSGSRILFFQHFFSPLKIWNKTKNKTEKPQNFSSVVFLFCFF